MDIDTLSLLLLHCGPPVSSATVSLCRFPGASIDAYHCQIWQNSCVWGASGAESEIQRWL